MTICDTTQVATKSAQSTEKIASKNGSRYDILSDHNKDSVGDVDLKNPSTDRASKSPRPIGADKSNLQCSNFRDQREKLKAKKGMVEGGITISASDDSLLAAIKLLKVATTGEKGGEGSRAKGGKASLGLALKDLTNIVG